MGGQLRSSHLLVLAANSGLGQGSGSGWFDDEPVPPAEPSTANRRPLAPRPRGRGAGGRPAWITALA